MNKQGIAFFRFLPLLLFCGTISAQNDTDQVKQVFAEYRILIEEKEYDKAFGYYLEDFLKYIPKKELSKQFSFLNNNSNFDYSVKNSKITYVSEILVEKSIKYCLIRYRAENHLVLKEYLENEDKERIKNYFKNLYNENYSFIESENRIITRKEKELIGVKETNWKFVLYMEKLNPYMPIWIPEDIMKGLLSN